jgi:hypothetical protein
MSSPTVPFTTNEVLDRIHTNPNPRGYTWRCHVARCVAWGRKHNLIVGVNVNRDAALDSIKSVLACIGTATVLGDFATMRFWMAAPCVAVAFVVWYIDYLRHF